MSAPPAHGGEQERRTRRHLAGYFIQCHRALEKYLVHKHRTTMNPYPNMYGVVIILLCICRDPLFLSLRMLGLCRAATATGVTPPPTVRSYMVAGAGCPVYGGWCGLPGSITEVEPVIRELHLHSAPRGVLRWPRLCKRYRLRRL